MAQAQMYGGQRESYSLIIDWLSRLLNILMYEVPEALIH